MQVGVHLCQHYFRLTAVAAICPKSGKTLGSALGLRGRSLGFQVLTALQNVIPQLQKPALVKSELTINTRLSPRTHHFKSQNKSQHRLPAGNNALF